MTVLFGENAADESSGPPRKKFRLCLSSRNSQVRTPHDRPGVAKGAMLNGYIPTDGHNKSSPDESPVSDGAGCSPVATLCNLGNTCFLNSVIYTLRFAPAFLHNLHHLVADLAELSVKHQQMKAKSSSLGRNMGSSSGGSKGWSSKDLLSLGSSSAPSEGKSRIQVATERLHDLYVALHASEIKDSCDPFQPDVFLHALREVNPIFEGNQQHDAHELLVCLLDNVRETCRLLATQAAARRAAEAEAAAVDALDLEPKALLGAATLPPPSKSSWGVRKSWKKRKNNAPVAALKGTANGLSNGAVPGVKGEVPDAPMVNGGTGHQVTLTGIAEYSQEKNTPVSSSSENIKSESNSSVEPEKDTKKQNVGYNFVADDFEGVAVLRTTCLECEHVTERKETFCDICVPINPPDQDADKGSLPQRVSELYQAAIVTSENLRDLNKYWCEQCLRYNEACRSVRYETLPRLLVLQLKRFSSTFGSMVCMSKVNDYMPTPLKLACFCEKCSPLPEEQRPHQYQLYGVIMHLGATIASGHYVAYVKASENGVDYFHCSRDKRKTVCSLSSAAGKSSGATGDKMGGILKFFRPKTSNSGTDTSSKSMSSNSSSSLLNRNTCRSFDCCGVKLNSSVMGAHLLNGVGDLPTGAPHKEREGLNPAKTASSLPVDGVSSSMAETALPEPEPVWLECDDDTVRLLTRKEFEEVLAPKPSKNSALTPYLLFFARV